MDKALKFILNSLKCPVCRGQIDLITTSLAFANKTKLPFNYGCAANNEHYLIWLPTENNPNYILHYDKVVIYEGRYQYEIVQDYPIFPNTQIIIRKTDLEHRVSEKDTWKIFEYSKILFDWKNTNRDKVVNRIKTILTFQ